MEKAKQKTDSRAKRHHRLRHRVSGTATRPRLAVYRSNKFVYAQLIDDEAGTTLAAADSRTEQGSRLESARAVGTKIATQAQNANITEAVFDRGGFRYMGIVAAVAEAARAGGLKF